MMVLRLRSNDVDILVVDWFGTERSQYIYAICLEILKKYGLYNIRIIMISLYNISQVLKSGGFHIIIIPSSAYDEVQKIIGESGFYQKNFDIVVLDSEKASERKDIETIIVQKLKKLGVIQEAPK